MAISLGVLMDPIATINTYKDSTFAMLLAAQSRGCELWYMEQHELWSDNGRSFSRMHAIEVTDNRDSWFRITRTREAPLDDLDVLLMRKDPPFDIEYITTTYLLDDAERRGTLVVNPPRSLRDNNEKVAATLFPDCCPPTLISREIPRLLAFLTIHGDIVVKPLDSMGGQSVFRIRGGDSNTNVILETITQNGRRTVMAQRYIPEITEGDKRVLLVEGRAVPYALARIPKAGELRGNLAAGGSAKAVPLTDRDRWICEQVGSYLRQEGILFAGLDIIGDYLTEINITSPTCIRELDAAHGLNIAGDLMDAIERKLQR